MTLLSVYRLDMLPGKWLLLLTAVLLALWLLTGLLLFCGRRGGRGGSALRWIACILLVLIVAGCLAVFSVVVKFQNTVNNITKPTQDGVAMTVYVRKDDPAKSIQEAKDYTFAVMAGYETERTQQTVRDIEKTVGQSIRVESYPSVGELVGALYADEVDAIILNSAYVQLFEDTEEFVDFSGKTRVLYEVVLQQTKPPADPSAPTRPRPTLPGGETLPEAQADVTNTPFVVYISGSDSRDNVLRNGRNDVNIMAVVNPVTKQVLLVNTPRDYYVENPAGGGARDKLTHCGIYGVQCSMDALANLYGIQVDYYARINFAGFKTLIDAIGGITVYADNPFMAGNTYPIVAGENFLNGEEALAFARDRYRGGGDTGRGKNQMKVITGVIDKLTSSTALITGYSGIMDSLEGMFQTDVSSEDIGKLVKMQLGDMAGWSVLSYAVAGKGGSDITYSMPGHYLYVMYVDQDKVDRGTELINRVLSGDILTAADVA